MKEVEGAVIVIVLSVCVIILNKYVIPFIKMLKYMKKYSKSRRIEDTFEADYSFFPYLDMIMQDVKVIVENHSDDVLKRKQAEYIALQNQINPHFLYNTLEAIRGDAIMAGMNHVGEVTKALAVFFRYTVTEVEHFVCLEDELDNAENYFTIQKYRFGEKIEMEVDIPDNNYELLQAKIPKLILQPIIENAIFHGLEPKLEIGKLIISIENTKNNLIIRIKDNGIGISKKDVDELNGLFRKQDQTRFSYGTPVMKKGGIALPNINSRLKLLFGEDYGINIFSLERVGTEVHLVMPLMFGSE